VPVLTQLETHVNTVIRFGIAGHASDYRRTRGEDFYKDSSEVLRENDLIRVPFRSEDGGWSTGGLLLTAGT
jgi:hypothetical protein